MYEEVSFNEMRRLVRLAVWAAFMALGAWVSLPIGPVPITLQTFFIFLAAFIEGPMAALAVLMYVAAGLIGLPVFTGGQAGPAIILGPTAGYVLSFPLMALISSLGRGSKTSSYKPTPSSKTVLVKMLIFGFLGLAIVYLCGSVGLVINAKFSFPAALALNVTFLPGDLAKVVCAAIVACGLARARARTGSRTEVVQAFNNTSDQAKTN
jgi:biotin transport system substrate-specific component